MSILFTCNQCEGQLQAPGNLRGAPVKCPHCGEFIRVPDTPPPPGSKEKEGLSQSVVRKITEAAGVERIRGFDVRAFFSEVFRKHPEESIDNHFTVGSPSTTPPLSEIETSWPRPWVFFRVFVGAIVLYLLFSQGYSRTQNPNLIPGLILVGSFAVPMAMLILFFEINVRRNVSAYQVLRLMLVGGVISIMVSLFLFSLSEKTSIDDWLGHSVIGLAEEAAKVLALLVVVNQRRFDYTHNGLLFGAAVGTGFAAFETAGYALQALLTSQDIRQVYDVLFLRGLLSPLAHIVWTAICGAALWRVKRERRFRLSHLFHPNFLRVFTIAVLLHMTWNSSWQGLVKFAGIGLIAWVIVLGFIQTGLREIAIEKANQRTGQG
ncbi:MAG: PrsW family intramembrane metalloprotease [Verrucomicrobiota bacterium]